MSSDKKGASKKALGQSFLKSAKLKCQFEIEEAKARINLYTTKPVGIGDHPNIMDEILKAAADGAHAQDILNFLEKEC